MKSTDITERYSQHPLYRGISVITPLPFGEGKGEGPAVGGVVAACGVQCVLLSL